MVGDVSSPHALMGALGTVLEGESDILRLLVFINLRPCQT